MFKIETIDPKVYRKKTRNATLIIMFMFIIIGFGTAHLAVTTLGEYSNNKLILNLLGAFVGLMITGLIVKTWFADKDWMKESMYSWRLKRNLMHVTNVLQKVKDQVDENDAHSLKILRFYHLGLEQMHQLEDNNHALIDLGAEKRALEVKMTELGQDLNQTEFDPQWIQRYKAD
ncbi:DUF3087 family protein [Thiomicrorhabdus arctica]|uniref:DUF3087 family protein n=1 Tax=Thiomicrorhabdus arctica TaxID=131540 RepID=UPI00037D64DC|nr:DUF3087 family protein [Thiomicrorhabdus arctica]